MHIVPVEPCDFDQWLAMRQALYTGLDEAFHRREMDKFLMSPELACFVGQSSMGDGTIGLIELSLRNIVDGCVDGPVGYIEGLYVQPGFRGQSFGRQLITFAESWFTSQGCRDMATDSELENTSAQHFFRRAGFTETWRIVEFKKSLR